MCCRSPDLTFKPSRLDNTVISGLMSETLFNLRRILDTFLNLPEPNFISPRIYTLEMILKGFQNPSFPTSDLRRIEFIPKSTERHHQFSHDAVDI